MSRIGKKTINLPSGVTCEIRTDSITVKGPKGEISQDLPAGVSVAQESVEGVDLLRVSVENPSEQAPIWGTIRALVSNMVAGVSEGWEKSLELNGVGFKMDLKGKKLVMRLGFSHEIEYEIPDGITASIDGMILKIEGISRELVGKVTSEIRSFKKPEPYKGKGFRYTDEVIRRKAGKAAKSE
jgi:large subunit ribosomal protein L6